MRFMGRQCRRVSQAVDNRHPVHDASATGPPGCPLQHPATHPTLPTMNAVPGRSLPSSPTLPSHAWTPISRAEIVTVALLAAMVLWLVAIALSGDQAMVDWLTSEDGPLEWTSVFAWLLLAGVVLATGGLNRHTLLLAAVSLLFCARELDLHKQAVFGGVSFLKINFYRLHDVLR